MLKTTTDALPVRVYTKDFLVHGDIHLPAHVGTVNHLNNGSRPFLPITDATAYRVDCLEPPADGEPRFSTDFLAIPKERILWIAGGRGSDRRVMTRAESRKVYLLYPNYFLRGELKTPPDGRLSDYLTGAKYFQVLYEAEVGLPSLGKPLTELEPQESFEFAVVNTRNLGGIFDLSQDKEESLEQF